LSPIPHEIQARTGRKFADMTSGAPQLITVDINGNEATNGQYLFPFGINLGGITVPEMVEIDLNALQTPTSFTGIPWNLDRRLSPGGCLDANNDGIGECETTPQPLIPFPFEGVAMDPRNLSTIPATSYSDPNYVSGSLNNVRDRILSYVNPTASRLGGNAIGVNDTGNFTTSILTWDANSASPSPGSPGGDHVSSSPVLPQAQICSANSAFNTPPVAQNDSASTASGTATTVFVLLNDSDVNGDPLTVTGVSTPSHGTAAINIDLASVTYTPALGFSGMDTFTYTVFDGTASVTATVTVNVIAAVNNLPIAVDDTSSVAEDGSVSIDVLANDTDNDSGQGSNVLSVASVSSTAKGGTVTITGDPLIDKATRINYTPKSNFNGVDTFTYVVSDGRGGIDTGAVNVTVTAVNDAPVANPETATVVTGGPAMVINVLDNDTDVDLADLPVPDKLTVSLAATPLVTGKGSVTTNGSTVSYTASPGATGTDSFSYTITDKGGLTATATVTVTLIVPVKDVLQVTLAQLTVSKSEWRVQGTGTVPSKTVTVRLGGGATACTTGGIVGTSAVDTLGNWIVRVKPGISAGANTAITACSNGGGKFISPITFK
jgi:Bacterial Ig domain